jgi:DNA helicase-2/ATP-dependent DNA helicase PcrA
MMTLHSAKGLEFKNVFIPGMEENIFPSYRSVNEENRLEEERRLMYVGITRAKRRLFLTRAEARMLYNQFSHNPPSRFLKEIPGRLTEEEYSDGYRPRQESHYVSGQNNTGLGWKRREETRHTAGIVSSPGSVRNSDPASYGKPKLTFRGVSLDQIPGVSKGFVPSAARQAESAIQKLFQVGDRVMHPKFGNGSVLEINGSGAEARIIINFDSKGRKELSLALAPIVKAEEQA